jgi:Reverse transcriptase (RNA-dependent DNA polymerase)
MKCGESMQIKLDEKAFAGVFRAGDSRKFGLDLKKDRANIILKATIGASTGYAKYGPIHSTLVKGRNCNSVKDYSQALILRILARFIARRFRVDIKNRDRMVRSVIEGLSDSTPIFIVRRDISSFYESIPIEGIIKKLTQDIFIPTLLRQHIDCFFKTFCSTTVVGVPRGICVSPILAELAIEDFDKEVKKLPGVYKYFRYSDDILIFSHLPTSEIESKLPSLLPNGMVFNEKKSFSLALDCNDKASQVTHSIEYLGYSYKISNLCGSRGSRGVEVCISERKILKLKMRIFRCFKVYQTERNFELLKDRLRFLSGNYMVLRHGVNAIKSSKFVKSGIFYNYKLCGKYSSTGFKAHCGNELKSLDGIYQSLIKPSTKIGSRLTASQYLELRQISFFKGFELKLMTRFSQDRVTKMKRAWRNG